jgi:hypothetical protein
VTGPTIEELSNEQIAAFLKNRQMAIAAHAASSLRLKPSFKFLTLCGASAWAMAPFKMTREAA